jgi:hypothetical protein
VVPRYPNRKVPHSAPWQQSRVVDHKRSSDLRRTRSMLLNYYHHRITIFSYTNGHPIPSHPTQSSHIITARWSQDLHDPGKFPSRAVQSESEFFCSYPEGSIVFICVCNCFTNWAWSWSPEITSSSIDHCVLSLVDRKNKRVVSVTQQCQGSTRLMMCPKAWFSTLSTN